MRGHITLERCGREEPRTFQTGPRYPSFHPEEPQARKDLRISRPRIQRLSHFLSTTCWFRPELPRNPCIVGQKADLIVVHFLTLTFVFMHIVGSIFIFNIFMGQRPVPDLDQRVGEPPQLAQAGIFHPLQEHRVFVGRSHQDGVILG